MKNYGLTTLTLIALVIFGSWAFIGMSHCLRTGVCGLWFSLKAWGLL